MNGLQDLISKLQKIEEKATLGSETETVTLPNGGTIVQDKKPVAPAAAPAADPQRAAYDQFKADDAKKAAIETVKKYMAKPIDQIGRLENLIDPKTGVIYYGQAGMDASKGTPTKMPMRFMSQGDQKTMMDAITTAGLKVVDSGGYAMIDPKSLATLGQAPAAAPSAAAPTTGSDQKPATANIYQPKIDRLKTILGLGGSNATVNTTGAPTNTSSYTGKESISFKSAIGQLLAESGALTGIVEAPEVQGTANPQRAEADAIWSELSKAMETPGALTPEQRKSVEELTQVYQQFQQNNPIAATPATPTAPTKKLAPVDPGTKELQTWLKNKGYDIGKFGADGRWGPDTQKAIDAWKAKGLKTTDPEYAEFTALVNKAKDTDYTRRALGQQKKTAPAGLQDKLAGSDQKAAPAADTASTGNPNLDVLNKVQNPTSGMEYWVNGSRFAYRAAGFDPVTGKSNPNTGWYKNLDPNDKLQLNANRVLSSNKYTGPDDDASKQKFLASRKSAPAAAPVVESGFANDELTRLVSLIHHR